MATERQVIGECEQAGWPISAPIEQCTDDQIPKTTMRWRKLNGSFVLEQWKLLNPHGPTRGIWVEVPCVE